MPTMKTFWTFSHSEIILKTKHILIVTLTSEVTNPNPTDSDDHDEDDQEDGYLYGDDDYYYVFSWKMPVWFMLSKMIISLLSLSLVTSDYSHDNGEDDCDDNDDSYPGC